VVSHPLLRKGWGTRFSCRCSKSGSGSIQVSTKVVVTDNPVFHALRRRCADHPSAILFPVCRQIRSACIPRPSRNESGVLNCARFSTLISDRQESMFVTRERAALICAVAYGAFVLIAVAPGFLFSYQLNQSPFYRVGVGAYAVTLFPAALVGFLSRRLSGTWMLFVSLIALVALWHEEILRFHAGDSLLALVLSLAWWAFVAAIPGVLGMLLLQSKRA